MRSSEIRKRFLDYFRKNGHTIVPSSGLVPKGDPTLLFTNAGMVQFKGVFLNEETREYKTAVSCQRCMRAGGKHNDLENVGRTARHHTFFEMLGNFSFGGYFKEGAIKYAWDFLTNEMKLPKDKLWVTVFETDDEAATIWKKSAGVSDDRIVRLGAKDNFWSMGDTGPCGPCSEILIDQGVEAGCGEPTCAVGCDCDRYLELWNLVFMQYNRSVDGKLSPLPSPCIDTGMGLERLSTVLQGKKSNYDNDLFSPIINFIETLSSVKYGADRENDVSIKAIADHARAISFLMTDGVLPSNEGRGYVLRRIIRRAARHGKFLGLKEPFLYKVNARVVELMGEVYPELKGAAGLIERATKGEEERFFETLERGLALLEEEIKILKGKGEKAIPGEVAFKLYDTFGFPSDLTADIVRKEGFSVDEAGFNRYMDEQKRKARESWKGMEGASASQDLYKSLVASGLKTGFVGYHMEAISSRVLYIIKDGQGVETAFDGDIVEIITAETPFYGESGGQVGDTGAIVGKGFSITVTDTKKPVNDLITHACRVDAGSVSVGDEAELVPDMARRDATRRNHTATHILHAILRKRIGEHVRQAGSLVEPTGFRFDFNHFEAIGAETLKAIEEEANRAVLKNIEVSTDVLSFDEAVKRGALAFFGEKYGATVRMVSVKGVSSELCGGTHVNRTGDIGLIKITGEGSVASGVRRLEAVTGESAWKAVTEAEEALKESAQILKVPRQDVPDKIRKLLADQKELQKEIERLKGKGKAASAGDLLDNVRKINDVSVLAVKVEAGDAKELREMADALRAKLGSGIVVLAAVQDSKALLLAAVTKDLAKKYSAGEIIKKLAPTVGGRGGGKEDLAQAGGPDPSGIKDAIESAYKTVEEMGR
ncbi:MAG: alanine--tRNA ligase [Deltaproteobacteria bacterium GWB2_55_19]|nr:MAG: alanine--tRNA ligase [Deltaproteobacteria bacterium GWB2_55_19]